MSSRPASPANDASRRTEIDPPVQSLSLAINNSLGIQTARLGSLDFKQSETSEKAESDRGARGGRKGGDAEGPRRSEAHLQEIWGKFFVLPSAKKNNAVPRSYADFLGVHVSNTS